MNKLLYCLLFTPIFSFSQDIPKLANTIIVKGVSFDKVVNTLLDSGYKADKIDKDFQTVKTEWRALCPTCAPEICINVRVKDSMATVTGQWRSSAGILLFAKRSQSQNEHALVFPVQNEKSKVPRKAFEVMDIYAKALNGEITYLKQ